MELAIAQTSEGDAVEYLHALQKQVPAGLAERTEILDVTPSGTRIPRLIVCISDADETEHAAIRAAVRDIGDPAFELTDGNITPGPVSTADPEEEAVPEVPDDLAWMNDGAPLKALASPVADVLKRVMTCKPSGQAFPELAYEGLEKDAYDAIVKQLGIAPMDDQGDRLTPKMISDIRPPRRPAKKKAAWENVLKHLEREVTCFAYARDWFGDGGHLRNMYRDDLVFDHHFLNTVNKNYGLVQKVDTKAVFFMDLAMTLMKTAAGKAGPTGVMLGTMMGHLWSHTKSNMGDPSGKISAAIKDLGLKVDEAFIDAVLRLEDVHDAICRDWGNLEAFSLLRESGDIQWPKKLDDIRRAHALGFHYEAFRVLIAIKSKLESKHTGYSIERWGIVSNSVKTKTARKRKFDKKTFKLGSASGKSCGGQYYSEIFIGHQFCDMGSGTRGPRWHKAVIAGKDIPKKMFGTDTGNQLNPDLGISDKMLDDPKWREKHAWVFSKI
ncbi:hypothetical protein [Roseobacter sp.]|uniref:hypothetical protein n=1 Tax=Roseobacter sp. TaxID=1907202 RepID=UPI0025EC73E6|nr:hypothetical protein [Roseobacter sp.]